MNALIFLLFASLLFGQLTGISVAPGVTLYLRDFAAAAILVYGIFTGAIRRSMTGSFLVKPIGVFGVVCLLSLLVNASLVPTTALWKGSLYLLRWVVYAGVYFALVGSLVSSVFLLRGLFFLGTGLAVAGLFQFVFYPDLRNLIYLGWDPHYYRVFSTLFDPNFVGILFVLTLIVGIYLFLQKKNLWAIGGIGVTMTALLLTYSRSSYLGFLAAIGTWIVIRKKWKVGLVGLLLFLVAIVYLPRPGREALSLDRFDSTVSRLSNWSESVQRISQKPMLGYGFNVLPFLQQESSVSSKAGAGIDNSFLFVGVTTGLVGLIAYGWLLWFMIGVGNRALIVKKTSTLGIVYLATLVALVVDSMFVNSLFYPWVMVWVWILTGVVEVTSDSSRGAR